VCTSLTSVGAIDDVDEEPSCLWVSVAWVCQWLEVSVAECVSECVCASLTSVSAIDDVDEEPFCLWV
jgi:hypothetical protein